MKLAFLLLGLVAADQATPAPISSDAGYGAEETYEPTYATATYVHHQVDTCFNGCSGCFNKHTGQCVPKSCGYHEEAYASEAYGETGYRRLAESQNEYGYEAPETTEAYAPAEHYEAPRVNCGCPSGFKDTYDFYLHHNTVLWIAFGLLFAPALCFLWRGVIRVDFNSIFNTDQLRNRHAESWEEVSLVRIGAGVVCSIASLAYLTMALGHGYIHKCDGRSFYYARYVDWMLTTPLMLFDLCKLAESDTRTRLFIIVMDVLMIGSGLIGGLIEGSERWAFFGFSMAAFLPVLYFLCYLDGNNSSCSLGLNAGTHRQRVYRRAMNLTVLSWIGYPVIWAVAEGSEVLNANGEAIAYTILDIISKTFFGFIIVFDGSWGKYMTEITNLPAQAQVALGNGGGSSML